MSVLKEHQKALAEDKKYFERLDFSSSSGASEGAKELSVLNNYRDEDDLWTAISKINVANTCELIDEQHGEDLSLIVRRIGERLTTGIAKEVGSPVRYIQPYSQDVLQEYADVAYAFMTNHKSGVDRVREQAIKSSYLATNYKEFIKAMKSKKYDQFMVEVKEATNLKLKSLKSKILPKPTPQN